MSQTRTSQPTSSKGGPTAHSSLVGGSTADRRIGCTASYQREQLVPEHIRNKSSDYADEGSALHDCIQYILENDVFEDELDEKIVGREFGDPPFVMTQDLVDTCILPCMDFVDALMEELKDEGEFVFELEKQCEMPGIPGAFGTSDLIFRTDKRSGIVDWKFGAGVAVKAEYTEEDGTARGNSQLLYYGRAAQNTLPHMFPDEPDWPVDLYIVQPRCREGAPISKHETDVFGLEEFRLKLVDAIKANQAANPQPRRGPWCTFASCKATCELHTGALLDMTKLAIIKRDTPDKFDWPAHMAMLLEIADIAEDAVKSIRAQAHQHLEDGGSILGPDGQPAWKLVPKRATEKYVDETSAIRHARGLGLSDDDIFEKPALKSPAQLGDTLARFKDEEGKPVIDGSTIKARNEEARKQIRDFTLAVSSGTTLAPADDKRPDVTPTPQLVEQVASKLASLTRQ